MPTVKEKDIKNYQSAFKSQELPLEVLLGNSRKGVSYKTCLEEGESQKLLKLWNES